MWARAAEVCLGCWLLVSPFVFDHAADETVLWATDFGAGAAVIAIALLAFWPKAEKLHLAQLAVAAYLIVLAFVSAPPPPPAPYQNYMTVALLLLVLGIIPSRSVLPPRAWQEFYRRRES